MINAKSTARNLKISEVSSKDLRDGCLIVHDGKLHELAIAMFDDDSGKTLSVMGLKDLATDDVVTLDLSTNFDDPIQVLGEGSDFIFRQNLFNVEIVNSLELAPVVVATGSSVEFARYGFIAEMKALTSFTNKRVNGGKPTKILEQALIKQVDVKNGYETYRWEGLAEIISTYSHYTHAHYEIIICEIYRKNTDFSTSKGEVLLNSSYMRGQISSKTNVEKTAKARFKARQAKNDTNPKFTKVY